MPRPGTTLTPWRNQITFRHRILLFTDATMSAFRVNKLCQHTSIVLLLGWHAKAHAVSALLVVKVVHVRNSKPQFNRTGGLLVRRRVQGDLRFTRCEFAPAR